MDWAEFAAAFTAFFASHVVPTRGPVRRRLIAILGTTGFTIAYSALSLLILGWLISAAGRAPHIPLWQWAPWQSNMTLALMAIACVIIALAVGRPNPLSFGGARNDSFDPDNPGIVRWTRHPLLVALAIWATAHLIANGTLAHILLFGSFAIFALAGGRLIDRRKQAEMGADWSRMSAQIGAAPLIPARGAIASSVLRLAAGVVLFVVLIGLHPLVLGTSPLP